MSREVFEKAVKLNAEHDDCLTFGGGEPTLHPDFWDFMATALASSTDMPPYIVTNGKITKTALALAKLAKSGAIGAALSQDEWHDSIDPEVIQAFNRPLHSYGRYGDDANDCREIRNVSGGITNQGRAKRNGIGDLDHCVCDCIVVEPDGRLWECGCRKVSFGTVFAPAIPDLYWEDHSKCSRKAT